jgi:uncharacterized damage-inducible protein DinB
MTMADSNDALRAHLARLLDWHDAHVDFDAAIDGVPPGLRGRAPAGAPHSLWQILEHIRIAQHDILDFCVNPAYQEMQWPEDYWPANAAPPRTASWDESIAAYRHDRDRLKKLVQDPGTDLFATIPHGTGQTYLREVLLVIDHAAYHVGQLVIVRRLLGVWPAGR